MRANCSFCSNGIETTIVPQPNPVRLEFAVARHPSASLSYEAENHRLAIHYDYDVGQAGNLEMTSNGGLTFSGLNQNAACNQASGTCYVSVSPSCTIADYQVRIRGCATDVWTLSNKKKLLAETCPLNDTTNCCPACSVAQTPCVRRPINTGSGNVSVHVPLFTVDETPMPLRFELSYESLAPMYPDAIS